MRSSSARSLEHCLNMKMVVGWPRSTSLRTSHPFESATYLYALSQLLLPISYGTLNFKCFLIAYASYTRATPLARLFKWKTHRSPMFSARRSKQRPAPGVILSKPKRTHLSLLHHRPAGYAAERSIFRGLGSSGDFFDPETTIEFVRSLFSEVGPNEFRFDANAQGKHLDAVAIFKKTTNARNAIRTLHDQAQGFMNDGKLTVHLVQRC
jgi:hypothetical protein